MQISASQVKELRSKTGAGMMDCKSALLEAKGDFVEAIDLLRKKGIASAAKKKGRLAKEGSIISYIHAEGRVGVLLEVNCETDFVARTDQFRQLGRDLAMQVAASQPKWLSHEEVPAQILEKEKEIAIAQLKMAGKPAHMLEEIASKKVEKFCQDHCLLEQVFVKNTDKIISQLLEESIVSLGENISVRRFSHFILGEDASGNVNEN